MPENDTGDIPFDFDATDTGRRARQEHRPLPGTSARVVRLTAAVVVLGSVQALGVAIALLALVTRWLLGV